MTLNITDAATTPKPGGTAFLGEYAGHIKTLYETGARPLTAVGGTGNAVTATMAVDLTAAGYVDGLCVSLTWGAANTAGVTLAINGGAAVAVLDAKGVALPAATLSSGLTSILRYTAGNWRIISSLGGGTALGPTYQAFTASGTWTKPAGYDDDTVVMVELWAGGGGGGRGTAAAGGGGGGYARRMFRIADLPSSVTVTIGAGGAKAPSAPSIGTVGGNTTFGSLLTAYGGGGGGGHTAAGPGGGGGGGASTAGSNGTASAAGAGGRAGGGPGGNGNVAETIIDAISDSGGGGGGSGSAGVGFRGGYAVFGGAGGGGISGAGNGVAGISAFGGNGGAAPSGSGTAPGGGGGAGAAGSAAGDGARGECRVWIFG